MKYASYFELFSESMKLTLLMAVVCIHSSVNGVLVEFWPNSTEVRAPNSKLTVFCSVISNSGIFWKANGKFINDWSESYSPGIDLTNTDVRDVIGGKMYNYTVEVRVSPQINNTVLECFSLGSSSVGVTTLIVAEIPSMPEVHLQILNATALKLQWLKPFSRREFPIINYTIAVKKKEGSSNILPEYCLLASEDRIESFIYANEGVQRVCQQLTFFVAAVNAIGKSTSIEIHGGFPIVPDPVTLLDSDVAFRADGSPLVKFIFSNSELCSPQTAKYTAQLLTVDNDLLDTKLYNGTATQPENFEWTIGYGLKEHQVYLVVIYMETITGNYSFTFNFSTVHSIPTTDSVNSTAATGTVHSIVTTDSASNTVGTGTVHSIMTTDSANNTAATAVVMSANSTTITDLPPIRTAVTVGVCLGIATVMIMGMILILLMLTIVRNRRKQRFEATNPLEGADTPYPAAFTTASSVSYKNGMVSNPIYEGPLYETICEAKQSFSYLPKQTRAQESCYVELTGSQVRAHIPLSLCDDDENSNKRFSNGAAAIEGDYTIMQPAKPVGI